jgi:hypothetical protein
MIPMPANDKVAADVSAKLDVSVKDQDLYELEALVDRVRLALEDDAGVGDDVIIADLLDHLMAPWYGDKEEKQSSSSPVSCLHPAKGSGAPPSSSYSPASPADPTAIAGHQEKVGGGDRTLFWMLCRGGRSFSLCAVGVRCFGCCVVR